MKATGAWGLVGILALAGSSPAQAQSIRVGGSVQRYTFADPPTSGLSRVELRSTVFSALLPLSHWLVLDAAGGVAKGSIADATGDAAELSGMTDTDLGVQLRLAGGRLLLRAGASLPASTATQSLGEASVAGVVGADLLPFTVQRWGGGGSAGGSVSFVMHMGSADLWLLGGYRLYREHEVLEGETTVYHPGDELRMRLALDTGVGDAGALSLAVGLERFTADFADGATFFRPGTRIEGFASYAFPVGMVGGALVYGGLLHRGAGTGLLAADWLPGLSEAPWRQVLLTGADLSLARGRATLLTNGEFRLLRSAGGACYSTSSINTPLVIRCPGGQGWVGSVGLTLEAGIGGRRASPAFILAPTVRVRVGEAVDWDSRKPGGLPGNWVPGDRVASGLRGWEVGLAFRLGAER